MKNFVGEFKSFLVKGNAVDMAVGFIFGAAFATVVKSFINNVIMPPIGFLFGGVDFSNLFIALDGRHYSSLKALEDAGAPAIKYGLAITDIISFIILGFVIFMGIRALNKMNKKEEEKKVENKKPEDIVLLKEIRDALVAIKKPSRKKAPVKKKTIKKTAKKTAKEVTRKI